MPPSRAQVNEHYDLRVLWQVDSPLWGGCGRSFAVSAEALQRLDTC